MTRALLWWQVLRWREVRGRLVFLCAVLSMLSCSVEPALPGADAVSWNVELASLQESDPPGQVHDGIVAILAFSALLILTAKLAGTGAVGSD